ncbi:hypothetical protein AQS8620_01137 [Aquimixticola soesokkakensis]|uniref:Uncharacterized protein n=1 Tax=Aquimixticola soesokkakensis TaxID=1519096 RepID=A0A1Y5SAI3_9RHOB|nr:hypothetical protein [Aquimixticola soesokkakensis]SLN33353.1 hypothetical protein AQS8620_01137 [Aquimixticola soesokkakensis]
MVPTANDPCWTRVLTSEKDLSAASLATKILVTRLRREVKGAPAEMMAKINELRAYFEKNAFALKDLAHF